VGEESQRNEAKNPGFFTKLPEYIGTQQDDTGSFAKPSIRRNNTILVRSTV